MFFCLVLAASIGKYTNLQQVHNNILKTFLILTSRNPEKILWDIFVLGMAAAGSGGFSYPESVANGWTGDCVTGTMQSPIDLDSSMTATVHSPIEYRNYFNGHFNKVNFRSDVLSNLFMFHFD